MNKETIQRGSRHYFREDSPDWLRALEPQKAGAYLLSLPDADNRTFWECLDPEMKAQILACGKELLDEPFPQLLLSDYREFCQNGNRSRFEQKYFRRRRMLTSLILAECVQHNGQLLDKILDGIYLVLGETSWCLPAHNSYIRDTPQLPVPDPARPVIDLFAAETGALLSCAACLLHSRFDEVSSSVRETIKAALKERIVVPYLSYHFWWMGDGIQPMLNWTPWITQNVLLSVLGQERGFLSPEQERKILEQAAVSLDYFLDEYGEDGCCNEGAQYFGHAGLCLLGCIEILRRLTGEERTGLCSRPLIRNMADYILRVYAGNGFYFNYADCSAHPGHRNARDYLFARYTGNTALEEFAAADYRSCSWKERLLPEEENLFYHLLQLENHAGMMNTPDHGILPSDTWFESTGILITRDGRFSLAARAGNNADNHNHNDVGSVILYKEGKPFLIDLGVETYTKKTFSEDRYTIWTMQSAYHNLPTFYDGTTAIQQKAGLRYEAACVLHEISEDQSWISMDLAPAYDDPRIRKYRRKVTLRKGDCARIEDEYDGDPACRLSLMTLAAPVVTRRSDDWFAVSLEDAGSIDVKGASDLLVERLPIEDGKLRGEWGEECFRMQVCFSEKLTVVLR